MKYWLITVSLLASLIASDTAFSQQHQTATGTVYLDGNKNNKKDTNEEGLAGIPVSNGTEVVLTDEDGTYSLPINEQEGELFVIKPAGYTLPVDSLNRSQFYYLHRPKGSPDLDFEGVGATGPLPESVNFPLLKSSEDQEFRVLLFGDPQPYTRQEVDYFDRDIVSELHDAQGYAFGISLGDLVGDNLDLFQPYSKSVAKIGLPWFNVYGNHDMNFDAQIDKYADETFESTFGPPTYSFNHGKAHFIILDDVIYPRTDNASGYIDGLTDKQLEFIENDLKHVPNDHLVVLAFHIPLAEPKWGNTFRLDDRRALFDLLKDYPHTLSLSAHTHIQQFNFFDVEEGWHQLKPHIHYNVGTTSGDWWSGVPDDRNIPPTLMRDGTPNGYAMLNIDGNSFTIDYKVADKSPNYRMSIWGPKVVPQDSWHGAALYVNYFLGSKYTQVQYRVKAFDDSWRGMNQVDQEDPHMADLRAKWDQSETLLAGKRPSNPVQSTHLWEGSVPNNLPLGQHIIEVQVKDMFGRTFKDEFNYKVVKP